MLFLPLDRRSRLVYVTGNGFTVLIILSCSDMIEIMKKKKHGIKARVHMSVLVLTRLVFVCVFILRYVLLFYLLLVEFSLGLLL